MFAEMIRVNSEAIAAIGYEDGVLYIQFHSGEVYPYRTVPHQVVLGLFRAHSKGTYYNDNIRGKYK